MKSGRRRNESTEYWVGLDVSKQTFDAALAGPGQRFPGSWTFGFFLGVARYESLGHRL